MLQVFYSVRAAADLRNIFLFGAERFGLAQAERYDADLRRAMETLAQFPDVGRVYVSTLGEAYRRYGCGRHVIFYRREADAIVIGRIIHDSMAFDRHL